MTLWGRDLLIAPVFRNGAESREVYLPRGDWYDWWTNAKIAGGQTVSRKVDLTTMPIYVRAGAIIPFDPVRQHSGEAANEPTTLRIYCGADGDFTLYEDDGASQEYLKGKGTWTRVRWNDRSRELTVEPAATRGATNVATPRVFNVVILPEGTTASMTPERRLGRPGSRREHANLARRRRCTGSRRLSLQNTAVVPARDGGRSSGRPPRDTNDPHSELGPRKPTA